MAPPLELRTGAHWIFGYGSIISERSLQATLQGAADSGQAGQEQSSAAVVEMAASAGWVREWCFRAPSGFTAVGLRADSASAMPVNGIIFRVGSDALSRFDAREVGYERVEVSAAALRVLVDPDGVATDALQDTGNCFWTYVPRECHSATEECPICQTYLDVCLAGCLERGGRELASEWVRTTSEWSHFWLNDAPMSRRPWLHRPRYAEVDSVLREASAHTLFHERRHPEEFSGRWTGDLRGLWGVPPRNPCFVGRDAALSRLASAMHGGESIRTVRGDAASGDAGGREASGETGSQQGVLTTVELVGMGGVGKTQLATEYAYRHFAAASKLDAKGSRRAYGLVVWLRAESAEALAADLRSVANDCGIGVQGLRSDQVIAEMRARLYRTRSPWLLVLDNMSSSALMSSSEKGVLPRGCVSVGHVLVTSRMATLSPEAQRADAHANALLLGCLSIPESLELLRQAGGEHLGVDELCPRSTSSAHARTDAGSPLVRRRAGSHSGPVHPGEEMPTAGVVVAAKLGYLPLALALAAAYMRACDVSCASYLQRLAEASDGAGAAAGAELLQGYPLGVAESFELSLQQLDVPAVDAVYKGGGGAERPSAASVGARDVLDVLAFCASENIPKGLVSAAIRGMVACGAKRARGHEAAQATAGDPAPESRAPLSSFWRWMDPSDASGALTIACGGVAAGTAVAACLAPRRHRRRWLLTSAVAAGAAAAAAAALAFRRADAGLPPTAAGSPPTVRSEEPGACARTHPQPVAAAHPLLLAQGTALCGGGGGGVLQAEAVAVADRTWLKLKQFSLLSVRENAHGERTGCLHRLLGQSLRAHMDSHAAAHTLGVCVWALEQHWAFDPADTTTWTAATAVLGHVQAVGRHTHALLRGAAEADECEGAGAGPEHELVAALQLRVSALLTQGALCMCFALSRFDQAQQALEAARAIQQSLLPPGGVACGGGACSLQRGRALTLDTAGKVARYSGKLTEAEALLREALQLWRDSGDEGGAAATLHELGVVHLRRAEWESATALLKQSLAMKRERRPCGTTNRIGNCIGKAAASSGGGGVGTARHHSRFREEAATLHQLAVAAMSSKPPRLAEADALLREALALEDQGPFALGARAATLQQLARVAERCGDAHAARAHLEEALAMQTRAYGEGVAHVNKAATLSQLASLALQSGDTEHASQVLGEALEMRRQIYGHGGGHVEVALNLAKLGECERARGGLALAAHRFSEARVMLEGLALREAREAREAGEAGELGEAREACAARVAREASSGGGEGVLQRLLRVVSVTSGADSALPARLLSQLLQAIRWQRTVAREAGEGLRAAELAAEAQQLQHALEEQKQAAAQPEATEDGLAGFDLNGALVASLVACRDRVRETLLEMRAAVSPAEVRPLHGAAPIQSILGAAEELVQVIHGAKAREATAATGGAAEPEGMREEAKAEGLNAALRSSGLAFVLELRASVAEERESRRFLARAFAACDGLRKSLREAGVLLTDLQSESAYRSRVISHVKRLASTGDYALSEKALLRLQATFGSLTVDAFASAATAQLPRFWSRDAVRGAEGIDAFAQRWEDERLLVHAPVSLLNQVVEKLEASPTASAVVVCPYWTGAPWFASFQRLASDSLVLPPGSLRAIATRTSHVKCWRAIAFYVPPRE